MPRKASLIKHKYNRSFLLVCHLRSSLKGFNSFFNIRLAFPVIQGWLNYYGHFYPSVMIPALQCLEDRLVKWSMRKYKHLRGHRIQAAQWLKGVAQKEPELFTYCGLKICNGWMLGAV
jgi:hypothetical protein